MYLFIAASLSAELHGIGATKASTWKDLTNFLRDMTAVGLGKQGSSEKLLTSLRESLDASTRDEVFRQWIGEIMRGQYTVVKEVEVSNWTYVSQGQTTVRFLNCF